MQGLELVEHRPEQGFGHLGIMFPVGVRKGVFARRRRAADRRQRPRMQSQRIANVVEAQRVGELRIYQAEHMTPRIEGPALFLHRMGAGQLRDQMIGNQIAKLPQKRKLTGGWLVSCFVCFFMPYLVARPKPASQLFLILQPSNPWDSNVFFLLNRLKQNYVKAIANRSHLLRRWMNLQASHQLFSLFRCRIILRQGGGFAHRI
jgi:hypothetical protein